MSDDITAQIATLKAENKTIFKTLDKLEEKVENVEKIASSVEKLATSIESMTKSLDKMEKKVDGLTLEPAEKWKKLTWGILMIIVGAVVGIALAKIGLSI